MDVGFVRRSGELEGTLSWHDLNHLFHGAPLTARDESRTLSHGDHGISHAR